MTICRSSGCASSRCPATPPVAVAAPAPAVGGAGAAAPPPGVAGCGPAAWPGTAPPPAGAADAGASPPLQPARAKASASDAGSSPARPVQCSQPHIARLRRLHFRLAARLAESPQFVLHRLDVGVQVALVQ